MTEYLVDKPEAQIEFTRFIQNSAKKESDYLFIPYLARFNYYFLAIDKNNWDSIELLDIRPPQSFSRVIHVNKKTNS